MRLFVWTATVVVAFVAMWHVLMVAGDDTVDSVPHQYQIVATVTVRGEPEVFTYQVKDFEGLPQCELYRLVNMRLRGDNAALLQAAKNLDPAATVITACVVNPDFTG